MKNFFNTTLGISMLSDADIEVRTVSADEAAQFLAEARFENVANPSHGNSLDAISKKLGVDVRGAKGGRVRLEPGDICLVAQISGIPRETREFTDEEIAKATFDFRLVFVGKGCTECEYCSGQVDGETCRNCGGTGALSHYA